MKIITLFSWSLKSSSKCLHFFESYVNSRLRTIELSLNDGEKKLNGNLRKLSEKFSFQVFEMMTITNC